ncbi:hypothetical protein HBH56_221520 [Parastagonospora nodorum]|uniref:Uncharacterized protein n=1 Tax=Phaeosphaeria nodorum (strain SN15 / ATCC MYA-4574 / FGSC 10173) TaxID=321614 RepID=A0A7U2I2N8_PHANO|nr:hypothetical protein HBH56_221520 [Parastagonospora nodorum]QRC97167.1 hypothetical protein JI435_201540 [Parastagonospora nodorum SN15]KAH3924097.1 hypothetical protein HBH54_200230 [Parastagonospora nodorum]KAH3944616.1 hypothetical protein HBH53_156600 [Parastagonospora nodorum]KAH3995032.1 hypothetical protein HBI10_176640 [Parastagonospora nodorum]
MVVFSAPRIELGTFRLQSNITVERDKEVKDRLREDGEYIAAEKAHAALLDEASAKLAELQEAGMISGRTIIPAGYSAHKGAKITELLMQSGENELVEKIRDGLKQRTLLLKRIRHRLQIEIRERKSKEHRALLIPYTVPIEMMIMKL